MLLPDDATYKDLNSDVVLPKVTMQAIIDYLACFDKGYDKKLEDLYKER